jgi:hypothetical protein
MKFFLTAETRRTQRRLYFSFAAETPANEKPHPLRGNCLSCFSFDTFNILVKYSPLGQVVLPEFSSQKFRQRK